jgi:hypothetical protein
LPCRSSPMIRDATQLFAVSIAFAFAVASPRGQVHLRFRT